ncbi:50S ribosomal protein L5 [Candidatus Micrarchaeota archaeon]|jgi:large subunit ribosomal protein L5|nr:50S ribosomal protein L5 [Candidatus Micrarchaeota archaeon]
MVYHVFLEKVTLNIGAGGGGEVLDKARELLEKISEQKVVVTHARARNPSFKIRKGDALGVKVTLRKKKAEEVLAKSLEAADKQLKESSFDDFGNVAFGVKEYIDYPGMKYDPKIGMFGFDVCVKLAKKGVRVASRRIAAKKLPARQRVSKAEAVEFIVKNFGTNVS